MLEENVSVAGPRETTLVGYAAPGPDSTFSDDAGTGRADSLPADSLPADSSPVPEARREPISGVVDAGAFVDRRNPLSRRMPINRGRHLSRQFFEEGARQQETGWVDSPLADDPEFPDPSIRFRSFDQIPRRHGPLLALAGGMEVAGIAAWAVGWLSPDVGGNKVWSALSTRGAGWKPAPEIKVVADAPALATTVSAISPPAPAAGMQTAPRETALDRRGPAISTPGLSSPVIPTTATLVRPSAVARRPAPIARVTSAKSHAPRQAAPLRPGARAAGVRIPAKTKTMVPPPVAPVVAPSQNSIADSVIAEPVAEPLEAPAPPVPEEAPTAAVEMIAPPLPPEPDPAPTLPEPPAAPEMADSPEPIAP
jgi:hypothetical protein